MDHGHPVLVDGVNLVRAHERFAKLFAIGVALGVWPFFWPVPHDGDGVPDNPVPRY